MVFSSNAFLFVFLPVVILVYYLIRRNRGLANIFLTIASLGFYAWGEPRFVLIMMASIVMNWLFGLWVDREKRRDGNTKLVIALMAVFNLGLLGIFKYLAFVLTSVNGVFGIGLPVPQIALPIGISFFTFQAMSYVIDVKRGNGEVQKNLINVALYISFFPQLIAGPIVRYQTVADEIVGRKETFADFTAGAHRFLIGLTKKVIFANSMGLIVDTTFAMDMAEVSVVHSWIVTFAWLLQLYFDFSGYSDMAIGLGRMFGFHFLENFDYPFVSKSITGFWRRWHISLGTWFRDYVYFPMGGSRVKTIWRYLFNNFIVWSLTGLWHGASWTYVLWGLINYVGLMIERVTGLNKWAEKHAVGHLYAIVTLVTLTIIVRCESLAQAVDYYAKMFGMGGAPLWNDVTSVYVREYGIFFVFSLICALPVNKFLKERIHIPDTALRIAGAVLLIATTVLSVSFIATDSYNPFIYFNF